MNPPTELLIVFLKAPRPGAVKTRLARTIGTAAACAAYRSLVEALLSRLQGLNAVELRFSPDNAGSEIECWRRENWTCRAQGAGPLGQRLRSAFEQAFSSGASRVAIIGSDCPAVTVQDIDEAWKSLRTHDVVLGPASDGGYWLIGSNRPLPQLFEDIAWSTEKVFAETIARVRRGGLSVRILRELSDVDTESDWRAFLAAQNRDGIKS